MYYWCGCNAIATIEWFDLLVLDDYHLDSNGITNFDIAECFKKQSVNPNAITVINSSSRDQEKSPLLIYIGKQNPFVEKTRLYLCQKLVNTRPLLSTYTIIQIRIKILRDIK